MNDLMIVSKDRCYENPFSLVKWLAEDRMPTSEKEDEVENRLITFLKEYARVGAKNMVKETNLRLAGHRLERKTMFLYNAVYDNNAITMFKINADGMLRVGTSIDSRWRKLTLKETKISIPLEVLQKLPDGSADKLVMFEEYQTRRPDPIIAVPVSSKWFDWIPENLYIGVAKW